jgi:hypothetical protein
MTQAEMLLMTHGRMMFVLMTQSGLMLLFMTRD